MAATAGADDRECPNDLRGLLASYREGLTHDSAQSHERSHVTHPGRDQQGPLVVNFAGGGFSFRTARGRALRAAVVGQPRCTRVVEGVRWTSATS